MNFKTTISLIKYSFFILLLGMMSSGVLSAQGWEIYFGGLDLALNKDDFGESVIGLNDGGYLLVGGSESFGEDNDTDVYVVRIDPDGDIVWSNIYDEGWQEYAYKVKETEAGNFILAGFVRNEPGDDLDAYFLEIDADGNQLWSNQFGGDGFDVVYDVAEANDGGFVFVGQLENPVAQNGADFFIIKTDETGNADWVQAYGALGEDIARSIEAKDDGYFVFGNNGDEEGQDAYLIEINNTGDILWERSYSFAENNFGYDLTLTQDGFIALTGYQVNPSESSQAYLVKVSATDGELLWQRTLGGSLTDEAYEVVETAEGDLVIVGITELDFIDIDILLSKYDSNGEQIWFRELGRDGHTDFAKGLANTPQGGLVVIGYNSLDPLFALHDVTLIRTDSAGNILSNYLQGRVYFDESGDCAEDPGEQGLTEWIVVAEGEENTYYGSTDADGNYTILTDTGTYDIRILPKNNYWEPCVAVYNDIEYSSFYDTVQLDFPIHDLIACPLLNIDVSAPSAQVCTDIVYNVNYCNDGTVVAQDPYVEIVLDEEFTFNSSTASLSSSDGNVLTFAELEDVLPGQCGSFAISVAADCGGIPLATYTLRAEIYPNEDCTPLNPDWDMSSIEVDGKCEAEEVKFTISNTSAQAMAEVSEFVIIEDQVMLLIEPFDLDGGEDTTINLAATGATYRLIAEQSEGHPGNSYPTVAVEGCALEGQETSTGSVTVFQEDENDAFVSVDVQIIDNENMLNGYPTGYPSFTGDSLLLAANTPLQYHLSFENTTANVVNRVVLRDTLPLDVLDVMTLESGASSHVYSMELYENGVVKFVFENMAFEPEEQAYIQFKINQKENLSVGTRIANQAEIYLGYEMPLRSNEVVYYVGGDNLTDFVTIDLLSNTIETIAPDVSVSTFPNPFTQGVTIELKGLEVQNGQLKFYNEAGQVLLLENFKGSQVHVLRGSLPTGLIVFSIEDEGKIIARGKALVR